MFNPCNSCKRKSCHYKDCAPFWEWFSKEWQSVTLPIKEYIKEHKKI